MCIKWILSVTFYVAADAAAVATDARRLFSVLVEYARRCERLRRTRKQQANLHFGSFSR